MKGLIALQKFQRRKFKICKNKNQSIPQFLQQKCEMKSIKCEIKVGNEFKIKMDGLTVMMILIFVHLRVDDNNTAQQKTHRKPLCIAHGDSDIINTITTYINAIIQAKQARARCEISKFANS